MRGDMAGPRNTVLRRLVLINHTGHPLSEHTIQRIIP